MEEPTSPNPMANSCGVFRTRCRLPRSRTDTREEAGSEKSMVRPSAMPNPLSGLGERRGHVCDDLVECRGIVERQLGELLAVQRNLGAPARRDELAVRQPARARGGIEADDPETAERALLGLPVAGAVRHRADDRLFALPDLPPAARPESLGLLEQPLAPALCRHGPFTSRHETSLLFSENRSIAQSFNGSIVQKSIRR